ncbi:MAG TPA: TolC family protein [Terriglobales bacterium]|nr:TolC family protein [Terriglobales bacterium]
MTCVRSWLAGAVLALAATAAGQSLPQLLTEAKTHNPEILAARAAWQAARQVPSQVSTLPDPQVQVQSFSIGGPLPFQGYSTSPMAYIGWGISENLPYPGKLKLRGEIATRKAAALEQDDLAVQRRVGAELETAYYRLADTQAVRTVLEGDQTSLHQIEQVAEARYRQGQGNAQDVLKAQLNETKLLDQLATNTQAAASAEARLKQLLDRPPNSPNLSAAPLTETPLSISVGQLLQLAQQQNPSLDAWQQAQHASDLQVSLAKKDFYPDFNAQFMWRRTDPVQFPSSYMLTLGVTLPIFRSQRQRPELAEALAHRDQARSEYQAAAQQANFGVQDAYARVESETQVVRIYRQGLIPQATAAYSAGLAAYETGREDFQSLLGSLLDLQALDLDYWNVLAQRESALAELERLTGTKLH